MNKQCDIIRTWKGWTLIKNATTYEDMLINDVFPSVKKKGVHGLKKVNIATKTVGNEVEFFLTLQFDSIEAVKLFAGENYQKAYIPDNAKKILSRYDKVAEHYYLKEEINL
jgi:hypothetical protein